MSDEPKHEEKKDAKPAAGAEPAKSGGLVPVIAAVVVLAGIGGGVGWYFAKSLTPAAVAKPGTEHGPEAGARAGTEHGAEADPHGGGGSHGGSGLLAAGKQLDVISLKGNVSGSGGTRYVTLEVGLWVPKNDYTSLNEASVLRLIQARLEETLKTYQLEDLGSPNIQARMKKDFGKAIEVLLRSVQPGRKPEDKFVLEVNVTSLLTQ
jgi:hypothetical protein